MTFSFSNGKWTKDGKKVSASEVRTATKKDGFRVLRLVPPDPARPTDFEDSDDPQNDYVPVIPEGSVPVTNDRKTCPHKNKFHNDVANVDVCPDCNSIRVHGFLNKRTGERLGGSVSGELSKELGNDLGFWEEWVQNPGKHNENYGQYRMRQNAISRAFGEPEEYAW